MRDLPFGALIFSLIPSCQLYRFDRIGFPFFPGASVSSVVERVPPPRYVTFCVERKGKKRGIYNAGYTKYHEQQTDKRKREIKCEIMLQFGTPW